MQLANYSDFRFENEPSILLASRIVIEPASKPHRVVLRKISNEYVTHAENVMLEDNVWKHADFYEGHYYKDQHEALGDFEIRSKQL